MPTLVDIDVYGSQNQDGTGKLLYGDDALSNAITFWLTSKKGEFINDPNRGGPLDNIIFKNLNENTGRLESIIRTRINENFSSVINLRQVKVSPDYENRLWIIDIAYTSLLTQETKQLEVLAATDSAPQPRPSIVPVPYTGENLLNFILIKQVEQPQEKLLYNEDSDTWDWGVYRLSQFTQTDPQFSTVLQIINGDV